jgi:Spy/CpxP family protein refolding chaperone
MTGPTPPSMSSDPTPGSRVGGRPRGRMRALLVLLLVAMAGGLAGVAVDRIFLLPRWEHGPRGPGGPGLGGPRDREFRDRFARELGLTPDQRTRIDAIMDREGQQMRAVRAQIRPGLDSIITRTRRQLDSVLTPEQRTKAEAIRKRHPRPPGPPPGDFPPGPN